MDKLIEFVKWFNTGVITPHENLVAELADAHGAATALSFVDKFIKNPTRNYIGISELGKPAVLTALKKLGYREPLSVQSAFTFHTGDWFESAILALMKFRGLDVRHEQEKVRWHDHDGHIDAVVDGVLVEIKSLSANNTRRMLENPGSVYGYATQLACYAEAMDLPAVWLVFNKGATKDEPKLSIIPITQDIMEEATERAALVVEGLSQISTPEDILEVFNAPPGAEEWFHKKTTGKLLVPDSMRYAHYLYVFYDIEEGMNGYKRTTRYITKYLDPKEMSERLEVLSGN